MCAPLTARDHWSEEEVEKGWREELCGLLCCFRSMCHVTNSGVTGGAGGEGVVTLFKVYITHYMVFKRDFCPFCWISQYEIVYLSSNALDYYLKITLIHIQFEAACIGTSRSFGAMSRTDRVFQLKCTVQTKHHKLSFAPICRSSNPER